MTDAPPRERLARSAFLLILPFLLLGGFLGSGLVSDDLAVVRTPYSLEPLRLLRGEEWTHAPVPGARAYRPLTIASFALDHRLHGASPTGFRATNFLLHGAVSALVAELAFALSASSPAAWGAGLLFAVAPVHHENVLWAAGRTGILAALFSLLVLRIVVSDDRSSPIRRRLLIFGGTALAAASYEAAIVLPALVFVFSIATPVRADRENRFRTALFDAFASGLAVACFLLSRRIFVAEPAGDFGAYTHPRIFRNLAGLVGRFLAVPRRAAGPVLSDPVFLAGSAVAVALLFPAVLTRKTHRMLLLGGALAAIAFLPFVFLPGYSDRFAYLSSAGFALALGAGIAAGSGGERRIPIAVLTLALVTVWASRLFLAAHRWREAGEITETIESTLRSDSGARSAPALRFHCIPDFSGAVPVYVTYFEESVRFAIGTAGPRILRFRNPGRPLSTASQVPPGEIAWRWNSEARLLERLDRSPSSPDEPVCRPEPDPLRP